jgi:hypothetical protein
MLLNRYDSGKEAGFKFLSVANYFLISQRRKYKSQSNGDCHASNAQIVQLISSLEILK